MQVLTKALLVSVTPADVLLVKASHMVKARDNVWEGATQGHESQEVGFIGGHQCRCPSQ